MNSTRLTDLPPELLDHIAAFIPTARSIANLGRTCKALRTLVYEGEDIWKKFNETRFPYSYPSQTASQRDAARTLTTLSKAFDRRAFVARYIEPRGDIRGYPGNKRLERWKKPRGQTIGFTPQLDCFETVGSSWRDRREVLAFSAGAELCVRKKSTRGHADDSTSWTVYRPKDVVEGRDDITSLDLLRPRRMEAENSDELKLVTGRANGNLRLLTLPAEDEDDVSSTHFVTSGQPVRSSTILQQSFEPTLLAANIGDDCVSLYQVDSTQPSVEPSSSIRIPRPVNAHRAYRAWSTKFLSSNRLAVGLGPSDEPIHIYTITPSGIEQEALRKYSLQNDFDRLDQPAASLPSVAKKDTSSIYPIAPLPPETSSAAGSEGRIFLTGGHDGIIRLHDLRSHREVEQTYIDPTDDSSIYSLLPRGRELLIAGASRHSLLKVFDLRLGAKAYSYLNNCHDSDMPEDFQAIRRRTNDGNIFLKPHSATYPGRGGGNNWARRSAESSIYSLATPSPCSPHIYAGVENAVLELAFTSALDQHPDPAFFSGGPADSHKRGDTVQGFHTKEVLDLAMYDQTTEMMKLKTQRSLWETFRWRDQGVNGYHRNADQLEGLDERWKIVSA